MKPIARKIILIVAAIALMVQPACKPKTEKQMPVQTVAVKVETVKAFAMKQKIHTSGRLFSKKEMKLSFKTGGIIDKLWVNESDHVKKGHTLASLNLSEINATVQQAKLALQKSQRDYERVKNLFEDSVATYEQMQNMNTALKLAQKKVEIAEFNRDHSVIKAPTDGRILKIVSEENEITAAGMPVMLFASDDWDWVARVNLIDKEIVKISGSDSASVFFDAFPNDTFYGMVSEVGNMADPYTASFEVEIALPATGKRFSSGMLLSADIFSNQIQNYLAIPVDALMDIEENSATVYVIRNTKLFKKNIQLAGFQDNNAMILSGISKGDSVITSGVAYIKPGVDIEIIEN